MPWIRYWRRLAASTLLSLCAAAHAAVTATDDRGVVVTLPAPAQRIIALAPHAAELVFAAGAGDRLVATVAWSDHPEAVRRLRRIGDASRLDMERIAALRPDLAVGWVSGNRPADIAKLARLGIPVFATEPARLGDLPDVIVRIGHLAATSASAMHHSDAMVRDLAALASGAYGTRKLRVFYEIWHTPPLTVGGRHFISDALAVCGAENVFGTMERLAAVVTMEAVVELNPDLVISADPAAAPAWNDLFRRLGRHTPVFFVSDPDLLHRPGPRLVEGAKTLCAILAACRTQENINAGARTSLPRRGGD